MASGLIKLPAHKIERILILSFKIVFDKIPVPIHNWREARSKIEADLV
jgi:hypothetical protein